MTTDEMMRRLYPDLPPESPFPGYPWVDRDPRYAAYLLCIASQCIERASIGIQRDFQDYLTRTGKGHARRGLLALGRMAESTLSSVKKEWERQGCGPWPEEL